MDKRVYEIRCEFLVLLYLCVMSLSSCRRENENISISVIQTSFFLYVPNYYYAGDKKMEDLKVVYTFKIIKKGKNDINFLDLLYEKINHYRYQKMELVYSLNSKVLNEIIVNDTVCIDYYSRISKKVLFDSLDEDKYLNEGMRMISKMNHLYYKYHNHFYKIRIDSTQKYKLILKDDVTHGNTDYYSVIKLNK